MSPLTMCRCEFVDLDLTPEEVAGVTVGGLMYCPMCHKAVQVAAKYPEQTRVRLRGHYTNGREVGARIPVGGWPEDQAREPAEAAPVEPPAQGSLF